MFVYIYKYMYTDHDNRRADIYDNRRADILHLYIVLC